MIVMSARLEVVECDYVRTSELEARDRPVPVQPIARRERSTRPERARSDAAVAREIAVCSESPEDLLLAVHEHDRVMRRRRQLQRHERGQRSVTRGRERGHREIQWRNAECAPAPARIRNQELAPDLILVGCREDRHAFMTPAAVWLAGTAGASRGDTRARSADPRAV